MSSGFLRYYIITQWRIMSFFHFQNELWPCMSMLYNADDKLKYKWKRCSKKKCRKQCGQVKFMGTMTKWPVQKHTEIHKTRSIQRRNRH